MQHCYRCKQFVRGGVDKFLFHQESVFNFLHHLVDALVEITEFIGVCFYLRWLKESRVVYRSQFPVDNRIKRAHQETAESKVEKNRNSNHRNSRPERKIPEGIINLL